MAHCTKKTKYNNGGLVARKEFKNIGSIEGAVSGDQNYRSGQFKATANLGKAKVSARKFKDSMGNSATNYSASYSKDLGKGFKLKAQVGKNYRGMSISKPL